jgi:altronate hydrolase
MVCTPGNDVEATTGQAAGGEVIPKAVQLNQDDFIPRKQGVSL